MTLTAGVVVAKVRRGRKLKPPPFFAPAVVGARVVLMSTLLAGWGATPGQRLVRLRVVDADTGRNLSFRRALLYSTVLSAASVVRTVVRLRHPDGGRQQLAQKRLAALQPRIRELSEQFADDPDSLSDALASLYKNTGVNPLRAGCLDPKLVLPVLYSLILYLPALRSAPRQTLHDRIAGAVVIRLP